MKITIVEGITEITSDKDNDIEYENEQVRQWMNEVGNWISP